MNAVSMNNLWSYLQGLSLSASNQRWLADHLIEAAENAQEKMQDRKIVFPKIPKDYKPSPKIMAMTLGPLAKEVNLEEELNERWKEWTK